jgi:hypothetical protein
LDLFKNLIKEDENNLNINYNNSSRSSSRKSKMVELYSLQKKLENPNSKISELNLTILQVIYKKELLDLFQIFLKQSYNDNLLNFLLEIKLLKDEKNEKNIKQKNLFIINEFIKEGI